MKLRNLNKIYKLIYLSDGKHTRVQQNREILGDKAAQAAHAALLSGCVSLFCTEQGGGKLEERIRRETRA